MPGVRARATPGFPADLSRASQQQAGAVTQAGLLWVRPRRERANPAYRFEARLSGRRGRAACVPGSGGGRVPQARCDQSGRGGHVEPDRQGRSPRPRSWPLGHRLDQCSHDAPGADHRADGTWPRARCAVSGSRRCRDGRDRHGPRRSYARPPAGHEAGRHRQRDSDAERPAGKLIPDRHGAAPHRRPGEQQRRAEQRIIRIHPNGPSAGRSQRDDRPRLGRHASKANGWRRSSAESSQDVPAGPRKCCQAGPGSPGGSWEVLAVVS